MLPDNLPSIAHARLPESYASARKALTECAEIDECKEWADRAAALASYARQAEDDQLEKMCVRIRARAIRRCGELLQEIEPGQGARDGKRQDGDDPPLNRTRAANDAGLSERQRKTALRVANVPADEFEAAVESDEPPTLEALAERGTAKRPQIDLGDRSPEEFAAATKLIGLLGHIERDGIPMDLPLAVRGLSPADAGEMLTQMERIYAWLNQLWEGVAHVYEHR